MSHVSNPAAPQSDIYIVYQFFFKYFTLYSSQIIVDIHDFNLGWKMLFLSVSMLYLGS